MWFSMPDVFTNSIFKTDNKNKTTKVNSTDLSQKNRGHIMEKKIVFPTNDARTPD